MARNDPEGQQLSVIHMPCYLGKIDTLETLLHSKGDCCTVARTEVALLVMSLKTADISC